jgi:DNA-binding NarL/FixJ family response regulator
VDTVRGHIRNIYSKLHVNCGREAVAKALRDRII